MMKKMNNLVQGMTQNMLQRKDAGSKEIIIEIGLAIVAIALLLIFRDAISAMITELIDQSTAEILKMFKN